MTRQEFSTVLKSIQAITGKSRGEMALLLGYSDFYLRDLADKEHYKLSKPAELRLHSLGVTLLGYEKYNQLLEIIDNVLYSPFAPEKYILEGFSKGVKNEI